MNYTGSESTTSITDFNNLDTRNSKTNVLQKTSSYWYCMGDRDNIYRSSDLDTWTSLGLSLSDGTYTYGNSKSFYVESDSSIHVVSIGIYLDFIFFQIYYAIQYAYYNGSSWSYTDLGWISTDEVDNVGITLDSSGNIYVFAEDISGSLKYTIKTTSWSSWATVSFNNTFSALRSVYAIGDKIYILASCSGYVECLVYYSGSWHTSYNVSDSVSYTSWASIGTDIYYLIVGSGQIYFLYGDETGLTKSVLFTNSINSGVSVCYDGTNLHCLIAYYDGDYQIDYCYGTIGSFSSFVEMTNMTTGISNFNGQTGFHGDEYRLIFVRSDPDGLYRYYVAEGETNATDPEEPSEPSTAGGRFYYYNSTQSTFKLARNIKYNDSGTYRIGRKLNSYGSVDGWKRVRF